MEPNTRSYAMVRTLILGAATLAIVGVLFAIYNSMSGVSPARRTVSADAETAGPGTAPAVEANDETPGKGVAIGGDVELGGGRRASMSFYDAGSDRATAVLSYRSWEPSGEVENQFHVSQPRISLRTPNGQLVEVRARSGLIQARIGEGDRPDLRHGKLMGDVEIKVDRLDERQRSALPEEERRNPGPDRLITIKLDDLEFDRDYARISTTGRFTIQSAEVRIESQGLSLRYNEADSSVRDLETRRGGRIVVTGMGRMLKVGLPGEQEADQTTEPQAVIEAPPAETEQPTGARTEPPEDGIPVLPLDEPKPQKVHPTIRYHAAFTGDVHVRETQGGELSGELVAEVLELLADFGQRERDAARAQAAPPSTGDQEQVDSEAMPPAPPRLTLTWSGPLVVKAVEADTGAEDTDGPGGKQRMQVTATGDRVRVFQVGRGTVRCRKLVWDEQSERLWLYGRPDAPASIETEDGGYLEGPEIALDVQAGTGRIAGPGRMSDTRSRRAVLGLGADREGGGQGADIRFQREVNVAFASAMVESIDPQTGEEVSKRRRYLQTAVFAGEVSMRQGGDLIAGERVELTFGVPRRSGAFADNVQRLLAEGDAALVHGEESLRCQRIDVEMGLDEGGHVAPRLARAYGDVSAARGERTITAGDRMIVALRSFRVEPEPWDIQKARAEAFRRGVDPDQVDWEEQRIKYESQDRFRPGVLRLDAYGGVKVHDPEQNLKVACDSLECTFRQGGKIDRALVSGSEVSPAHVELRDYAVTGREVELDVSSESAEVPGRGRLAFKSRRDLDGRPVDEAVPVVVTWSERMVYRGGQERAVVTGSVHAATEQSTFDCGELIIHFADRQELEDRAASEKAAAGKIDWWVFAPLVGRVASAFEGQAEQGLLEQDFSKEPVLLLASGGAVALTNKLEPGTGRVLSRGRIAGARILVDLRADAMTVEDAGNLLIEDYELPALAMRDAQNRSREGADDVRTPFGGLGVGSPSQTFIQWTGQMTYYFSQRAAFFERGVEMSHRSGTEIILGRDMVGQATYDAVIESSIKKGRSANLTCDKLVVQFDQPDQATVGVGGAGEMSGFALAQFEAAGRVHFQDGGIVVMADKVVYDALRAWLTIRGREGQQATIYDQRGKFREIKADVIEWDRQTGRIYAPKASVIGR